VGAVLRTQGSDLVVDPFAGGDEPGKVRGFFDRNESSLHLSGESLPECRALGSLVPSRVWRVALELRVVRGEVPVTLLEIPEDTLGGGLSVRVIEGIL
jgi:hypothetical protein